MTWERNPLLTGSAHGEEEGMDLVRQMHMSAHASSIGPKDK